jgi:hypothetical protein
MIGKYFHSRIFFSKLSYLFRSFPSEVKADQWMLTATMQGCQRNEQKQKDPHLIVWNPNPELRKSHVALSQITFEQHIAIVSLLKLIPTNSDLQEAKRSTAKRHARRNFCLTCRRTRVLGYRSGLWMSLQNYLPSTTHNFQLSHMLSATMHQAVRYVILCRFDSQKQDKIYRYLHLRDRIQFRSYAINVCRTCDQLASRQL